VDIIYDGTVYWLASDNQLHPYPALAVYNSRHLDNDFSRAIRANTAGFALPVGDVVEARK